MIGRLNNFIDLIRTIVTSGIALSSLVFIDLLRTLFNSHLIALAVTFFLVVLVSKFFESMLINLIANSLKLRRLIMGQHFIEGYWVDKVIGEDPDKVDSVAIFQIRIYKMQYEVSGESLKPDGFQLGTFKTYISEYEDFKLRYAYDAINSRMPGQSIEGYGEYQFEPGKNYPIKFAGFLHDSYHLKKIGIQAEKIMNQEWIFSLEDQKTRKQAIQSFLRGELNSNDTTSS